MIMITIEDEINVPARLFEVGKLRQNVLSYLNSIKTNKYDKFNDRLIRHVVDVINISDSRISMADSSIWLNVKYTVECINTDINSRVSGKTLAILDEGLFAHCDGFKILCVDGVKINSNAYRFTDCGCEYKCGDVVSILITAKDCKDDTLYCVGKHYHENIFSKFSEINDNAILNIY